MVVMNDDHAACPKRSGCPGAPTPCWLAEHRARAGHQASVLLLAIFDDASMWMAVFADMGASLLVVFNGLRLLRQQAGQ